MQKEVNYIDSKLKGHLVEIDWSTSPVSYSQFSMYQTCPLQYKLSYIDKLKEHKSTIHTLFGEAVHSCIQEWAKILYTQKIKDANDYSMEQNLMEKLKSGFLSIREKQGNFTSREELNDFYLDGVQILNYIKRKRAAYFDKKHTVLLGIELPIFHQTISETYPFLAGYLDMVIYDKFLDKYFIYDFKTSKSGWSEWDKKDKKKLSQLILYKVYFAKQYQIPIEKVEVKYIILRRKINTDSLFPPKRIQDFMPSQGTVTCNRTIMEFNKFLTNLFSGNPMKFPANSGPSGWNCTFCQFAEKDHLCPKENRICLASE